MKSGYAILFTANLDGLVTFYRDVVGLSYNEIAETLEVTLATVKWRIFKAREDVQLALVREGITEGALAADAKAS